MEEQKLEIINWEDGNDYIQRIDHVLQRSVITELLMGFLPLEEWGQAFMLTVEDPSKRTINKSQPDAPTAKVVTAAVVAFLANVRILLFDGPPGSTAPIVDYLLANNVRFPQNSVAGPAQVVNEFCQLWADRTGFKYTSQREQRVYGIQEMPRFPKKLKKPPGTLRKAVSRDAGAVALMYSSFLDELHDRVSSGYKGQGDGDEGNAAQRGKRGGDVFVVNSCINEGKVYLLEDASVTTKTRHNNYGIVSMLFVGDVKQDASAEISMIYTVPHKRRQGLSSLLVVEASKKLFSEGIFFVFVLEDAKVDTLNYRFLVKLGFRLEQFQAVGSLIDEGAGAVNEGSSETYAYSEPGASNSEGGGDSGDVGAGGDGGYVGAGGDGGDGGYAGPGGDGGDGGYVGDGGDGGYVGAGGEGGDGGGYVGADGDGGHVGPGGDGGEGGNGGYVGAGGDGVDGGYVGAGGDGGDGYVGAGGDGGDVGPGGDGGDGDVGAEAEWDGSSYDTTTADVATNSGEGEADDAVEQQQQQQQHRVTRRRGEAAALPRVSAPWIEEPHAVGGDATELRCSRPRSVRPPARSGMPAPAAAGPLHVSDTWRAGHFSSSSTTAPQLPVRPVARSQPDLPQPPPRRPTPPSPSAVSPRQDEPHSPRTQNTEQAKAGGRPELPPKPKPTPPPKANATVESESGTRPRYPLGRSVARSGAVLPPPRPRLYYTTIEQKDRFTNILSQSQRRSSTRAATRPPLPSSLPPPSSDEAPSAPLASPRSAVAVMARFGGVEPALPLSGPPPTLRRPAAAAAPAAGAAEGTTGGGAPPPGLQHMTKERPRPPVRRLPKRPDSEMRQQRMKNALKVEVCSPISTSTLEARLTMIPTAEPTDKSKISFEITSTQTNQTKFKNYTVYSLSVRRGDEVHTVTHRYSEFLELHKSIAKRVSPSLLPFFPGKKLFNSLSTDVVELRRTKLLAYMNSLVAMPEVMALCSEKIEAFIKPNDTT